MRAMLRFRRQQALREAVIDYTPSFSFTPARRHAAIAYMRLRASARRFRSPARVHAVLAIA